MWSFQRTILLFFIFEGTVVPATSFAQGMQFSVFWPCSGNAGFCAPRILGEGLIERDTPKKLSEFLRNKERHPYALPARPEVSFNSVGGDLVGAIELGRLIRKLGLGTRLSSEYVRITKATGLEGEVFAKDVICASACTFAFIGGVNRFLERGAKFGVHQFFGAKGNIGEGAAQVTVVALAAYVEEMGVSRHLLDIASLVEPSSIYWLSPDELVELRVDNMTVAKSQWRLDALNDGTVVAHIAQTKPGTQSTVALTILRTSGRPTLVLTFLPGRVFKGSTQDALQALNGQTVSLWIDGQESASYRAVAWVLAGEAVSTTLHLSDQTLRSMRIGSSLRIRAQVARAVGQYDPSLEFPLQGVDRYLPAALR